MHYEHFHHVAEPSQQLFHYNLHDVRSKFPVLELHEFFEVVAVAKLHQYVIPRISLDGLLHLCHKLTIYSILVTNLSLN